MQTKIKMQNYLSKLSENIQTRFGLNFVKSNPIKKFWVNVCILKMEIIKVKLVVFSSTTVPVFQQLTLTDSLNMTELGAQGVN